MTGLALIFPGQGAQYVGMGRDLDEGDAAARAVFAEADRALGYPLTELCFQGPAEALQATERAQPAILTVSIAALAALRSALPTPLTITVAAGHSLGEYSALVAAGSLAFADALRLVAERGRLMAGAAPGAMLAVLGLGAATLEAICRDVAPRGIVVVANHNAPDQLVLSGEIAAVEAAAALAREAGARRTVPLAVSGAFHSPLMASAAQAFGRTLARTPLADVSFPVVANTSAEALRSAGDIRLELGAQLAAPVRWADSVRTMRALGADTFVEVGPGAVLSGLVRRSAEGVRCLAAGDLAGVARVCDALAARSTS